MHNEHNLHHPEKIVEQVQADARPDRVCTPAQEGQENTNDQQHGKRANVSMCHCEDQSAEYDGSSKGHRAEQSHKDEAAKKQFFAEGRNDNAGKQRCVGREGSNLALCENALIVGLDMKMQTRDSELVEHIDPDQEHEKEDDPTESPRCIESSQPQGIEHAVAALILSRKSLVSGGPAREIERRNEKCSFYHSGKDERDNSIL